MSAARERFKPRVQAIDIAGRTPPNNPELEAAVIGAELSQSDCLDDVLSVLPTADPFYFDANRRIHSAVVELRAAKTPVDIATVTEVLRRKEHLQAVGGITYLTSLVDKTPYMANVAAYATEVRQLWRVRRAIEAGQQIAATGFTDYGDAEAFLCECVEKVANVADDKLQVTEVVQVYDVMKGVIENYQTGSVRGVSTGFVDLDGRTGGMRDGDLIIVAARPGVGKTAIAMNIAANVAQGTTEPQSESDAPQLGVMVFSLEMPRDQLGARMACTDARVDLQAYRKQTLGGDAWDRLVLSAQSLAGLPMWIDDTPAITLLDLRAKVRRKQHDFDRRWPGTDKWKRRIGLVVVDYLQLMRGSPNAPSREQEIAEISRGLKALAKELSVPVMALSQLNRAVETRSSKEKRPQLSDLRESGAIEQDADTVWFVFRPEMYFSPEDKSSANGAKYKGYAEVIVAKQRNGPTGIVRVTFVEDYAKFENRARDAWAGEDD